MRVQPRGASQKSEPSQRPTPRTHHHSHAPVRSPEDYLILKISDWTVACLQQVLKERDIRFLQSDNRAILFHFFLTSQRSRSRSLNRASINDASSLLTASPCQQRLHLSTTPHAPSSAAPPTGRGTRPGLPVFAVSDPSFATHLSTPSWPGPQPLIPQPKCAANLGTGLPGCQLLIPPLLNSAANLGTGMPVPFTSAPFYNTSASIPTTTHLTIHPPAVFPPLIGEASSSIWQSLLAQAPFFQANTAQYSLASAIPPPNPPAPKPSPVSTNLGQQIIAGKYISI